MVKVSFNSAVAQKDAAKKEDEEEGSNSNTCTSSTQVLILPPDAKVRQVAADLQKGPWMGGGKDLLVAASPG